VFLEEKCVFLENEEWSNNLTFSVDIIKVSAELNFNLQLNIFNDHFI